MAGVVTGCPAAGAAGLAAAGAGLTAWGATAGLTGAAAPPTGAPPTGAGATGTGAGATAWRSSRLGVGVGVVVGDVVDGEGAVDWE
jgi:hypothetical protein